jgi:hypothetical protein
LVYTYIIFHLNRYNNVREIKSNIFKVGTALEKECFRYLGVRNIIVLPQVRKYMDVIELGSIGRGCSRRSIEFLVVGNTENEIQHK